MFRHSAKWFTVVMCLLLVFTGFTFAASEPNLSPLPVAKLHGSFDLTSSDLVTIIVEILEPSVIEAKHTGFKQTEENVIAATNEIAKLIETNLENATVGWQYHHVFAGLSVELPQDQIRRLVTIPGIKAIYPEVRYQTTQVGAEISWEAFNPNMMDSAPYIGSQEAWDAGYTGKGVTVAIIDTGVDYTHPDLANAFGDYKGWDFVDNNDDPQETPPGPPTADDPLGGATTHGTHVAGTVAGNGEYKGVAPDATLLAYRVLGRGGSGSTANVLAGIEQAVLDGADIMNLSLGNTTNNPDFATSIALDWAMAEGVVAVTSNGNSGPNNWTVGSPGTSRRAISVGATRLPYNIYDTEIFTSEGVEYTPEVMGFPNDGILLDLNGTTLEFVHVGLGLSEDFVGLDLTGKVALISRGEIPFVEKSDNAKAAGAVATIIYNHLDGQIEHFVAGISLPTIKLSKTDGQKMLAELTAGNNEVTFSFELAQAVGETVADFSSRGPVMHTWMIKPDVVAPGVSIVSTVPTHNPNNPHGYAAKQGTSMSAPHVAGAAALILQANPDWNVEFVKAALMNTAERIFNEDGILYPHNSQGAGSIRVLDAIETQVLVTPGSHSFCRFLDVEDKEVKKAEFYNLQHLR